MPRFNHPLHHLFKAAGIGLLGCLLFGATPSASAAPRAGHILRQTLPEMNFTGVSFTDAVDTLRDLSGANLHVNWKALEEAGVSPDTQVNLNLRSVSLRKVLSLLLTEAGGGDVLGWYVDEGVIEITTRELADQIVYTRVYPVDDLVMDIPDFAGPSFDLQSISDNNSGSGGSGGGGSGGLFGDGEDSENEDEVEPKTKSERAEELVSLIKELIQPDVWNDAGGPASIRYFNGSLIVSAPLSVHETLAGVAY